MIQSKNKEKKETYSVSLTPSNVEKIKQLYLSYFGNFNLSQLVDTLISKKLVDMKIVLYAIKKSPEGSYINATAKNFLDKEKFHPTVDPNITLGEELHDDTKNKEVSLDPTSEDLNNMLVNEKSREEIRNDEKK